MFYRPVTYKKFSGSYEMLKQLLPSVLLKTEGFRNHCYMALSHKDWELPNIDRGLDFPM